VDPQQLSDRGPFLWFLPGSDFVQVHLTPWNAAEMVSCARTLVMLGTVTSLLQVPADYIVALSVVIPLRLQIGPV
jgi:hypothetical protein